MDILIALGIGATMNTLGIVSIIGVVSGVLTILTIFFDFPRKKITFKVFLLISIVCCATALVLICISNDGESEKPPAQTNPIPSPSESVEPHGQEEAKQTDANIESDSPEPSGKDPEDNSTDIEPDTVALEDVAWVEQHNIHIDDTATTTRGEAWSNCIRFGSSDLNKDGDSCILAACDQKYKSFTAKIAPQQGFDHSEPVTLHIYGTCIENQDDEELIFQKKYQINNITKSFEVEFDITGVDNLYLVKDGDYSPARYAGQYINGYTGMGVLMCDAVLRK